MNPDGLLLIDEWAGNTNHLADQFTKGATEAGHEVFRFDAATTAKEQNTPKGRMN